MEHVGRGVSRNGVWATGEGSSHVTVVVVILQQQLLVEADLLQLLAQFVQLTGQLLVLQFLQHQVLSGQQEDERGTGAQQKWQGGLGAGPSQEEQLSSPVMTAQVLRALSRRFDGEG